MFFIQVVHGRPGGRLQFSRGGSKMAWLASAFTGYAVMCASDCVCCAGNNGVPGRRIVNRCRDGDMYGRRSNRRSLSRGQLLFHSLKFQQLLSCHA